MTGRDRIKRNTYLLLAGFAAALAALTFSAGSAQAFWVGFGLPFPGCCYAPPPYYAYPPSAYYPPPPSYYAPPTGYYPPPGAPAPSAYAPGPGAPAPSAYAPAPSAYAPSTPAPAYQPPLTSPGAPVPLGPTAQAAPATPAITYTGKPAFTNGAGQTCREYKTSDGGRDVFGTACRQADGQWRVVN